MRGELCVRLDFVDDKVEFPETKGVFTLIMQPLHVLRTDCMRSVRTTRLLCRLHKPSMRRFQTCGFRYMSASPDFGVSDGVIELPLAI